MLNAPIDSPSFLNRSSKLPLYQQLYEILHGAIVRGEWRPGDMIPAESELIERYELSRITVRQVLDMLVKDGLIYRQRGRGSFVAHPTIEQTLVRVISFTEDMRQRGFEPGTQVLSALLLSAPLDVAGQLRIEPGTELAHICRLRLADGEPMSIEDSYLVHSYCPGVLERDYAVNSLRETLDQVYGVRIARARQVMRAVDASREQARLLSVQPHASLLYIERLSYNDQGVPVEYLCVHYRGDRYSLYSELHG